MNRVYRIFLALLCFSSRNTIAEGMRPETPDPIATQAYQQFWRSFDDYENHRQVSLKSQQLEAWSQVRKEFNYQDAHARNTEIGLLQEAARRYQTHLEQHSSANNAAYVKLNLAQIQSRIASLKDQSSPKSGDEYRKIALAILSELNRDYPAFPEAEEAEYLRATLLEILGQNESALPIWQNLAKRARTTLFRVHAHLAVGDHHFATEKPAEALASYKRGPALLRTLETNNQDYEILRFQYRIAWAAYRTADLDQCIKTGIELLEPGREFHQLSVKDKVELDAIELVGDALFEKDNMAFTRAVLQNKLIRSHAAAIGLRVMNRQMSLVSKEKLLEIGPILVESFPQAREVPEILTLLAAVYREQKQDQQHLATLERLSLLLPPNSLWRHHQKSDALAIKNMEEKSLAATQLLASQFYEQGLTQGTPASFKTALSYYSSLLRSKPQNPEAETWRLRRAHSLYYSDQWQEADSAYEAFKTQSQVSPANLELAFYQQILTREKIWQQSLQKTVSVRSQPSKDPIVLEKLQKLEESIDDFADRFPGRSHTVDLLLLAASANRDLDRFGEAEKYWGRSLLSEPNPSQRTLAIRGLVQARIRKGTPQETVAITKNYLKLENWGEMGSSFNDELRGVLSAAAKDVSKGMNKKGEVAEAGRMLIKLVADFPSLPDYDTLYRDGAYYLALGGAWNEAKQASELYLAQKNASRRADMIYLKARSQEYQMRFAEAASSHLELVEKYPRYNRSSASIQRAEDLAIAEDDYKTAGKAALLAAQYQKGIDGRYDSYVRASRHYRQDQAWALALEALQEAQKLTRQPSTRLKTKMEIARLFEAKGDKDQALSAYLKLAQDAKQQKENIDASLYKAIIGETNFKLAENEISQFTAVDLGDSESNQNIQLQKKAKILEKSLEFYAKSIESQDPDWATRARFGAGQSAEQMNQAIRTTLAHSKGLSTSDESVVLLNQSKRWVKLAQEYFSQNLLAKNREPHLYKDSIWIEKSAMKMSGLAAGIPKTTQEADVPVSIGNSTPYMWSH